MDVKLNSVVMFLPWLVFIFFGVFVSFSATKLISWAKRRKTGAIIFGAIVQMLMPDPYVQQTLETMVIQEKIVKKNKSVNGEPEGKDEDQLS